MRLLGIGIDLVEIARVRRIYAKYPKLFPRRILSPPEAAAFAAAPDKARFLAKRFAAKEAIAKALGTGLGWGVRFGEITITHDPHGRPLVCLSDEVCRRLSLGPMACYLSIADEREYAVAQALAACE